VDRAYQMRALATLILAAIPGIIGASTAARRY
jgi:hypothetical protein